MKKEAIVKALKKIITMIKLLLKAMEDEENSEKYKI